jgi:hypothetical protein
MGLIAAFFERGLIKADAITLQVMAGDRYDVAGKVFRRHRRVQVVEKVRDQSHLPTSHRT